MTATQNVPVATTSDGYTIEGGYEPTANDTGAKELDSLTTANSTKRGPLRVVTSALNGIIAAAAAQPTVTTPNTDTSWSFANQVRHLMLQNNTSANVPFSLDAAATAGSMILAPGATFMADIRVTAVHFYTAAAQNINGATAGNIVVWGWN